MFAVGALLTWATPAEAVVGGREATPLDNPSMVGLTERGASPDEVLFCGGALISPTVVVTAMHCLGNFDNPSGDLASKIDVVGGALSRRDGQMQRAQVAELVRHPNWDDARTLHDVLVLKLATPLPLPSLAVAGPADAGLSAPGSILRATGWGLTNYRDDNSQPEFLKAADIPIVADSVCSSYFGAAIYDDVFQICGKAPSGKPDTCQGDSGGPLIGGPQGAERLVGVVSFGPTSCGERGGAAVYADVASERDWILSAAGLTDAGLPSPAPTPVAPAIPPAKNTVKTRLGAITCSDTTCRITIKTSGRGVGSIKDVVLRVVRKSQDDLPPAKRFARAKKVKSGTYVARTLLPYGTITVTAVAYDQNGTQLGKPARETIEVE
ncbi:MAG: serine protease [Solirubrobacteraceae bacterium]|nr:serine protease [Solirubrobacteraceae bacterium]